MATRNIFKFFGSLGPAGSLVSLTEKVCSYWYPHAYEFGDENQIESNTDKEIRKMKENYIGELFKFKNKFTKQCNQGEDDKKKAFEKLVSIINEFIDTLTKLEKSKYMRERIFYREQGQHVQMKEATKNYEQCWTKN